MPTGIFFFDEPNFPRTFPFLDLLLARNCTFHLLVGFKPDESMHTVFFRKPISNVIFMLPHSYGQITCHTDVERAIDLTGEYVDAWTFHSDILPMCFCCILNV